MAVLGIVAEYNPFHNGHLYMLEEARELGDFSAIIVVMGGNFLQRGEPAFCDKWSRAEMALQAGADLIIELPFCFAARSAYYFAKGALQLLQRSGVATHLAFGSESGRLSQLQEIAFVLANEPDAYKALLKKHLSRGFSFPAARSQALQGYLEKTLREGDREELHNVLTGPNNILALEYLRVIEEERIPLLPLTIPRRGSSFHDNNISVIAGSNSPPYSSAGAIRRALLKGTSPKEVALAMPPASAGILQREINMGRAPIGYDCLEQAILVKLRLVDSDYLKDIYEVSEGLENRIKDAANTTGTLKELRHCIKSKRYSLTRINRILLYALFGLSKKQVESFDKQGPEYLHILGFSAKGQEILQEIKIKSTLKLFSRGSEVKQAKSDKTGSIMAEMLKLDCQASDVYSLLYPNPANRQAARDFTATPVRVPGIVRGGHKA